MYRLLTASPFQRFLHWLILKRLEVRKLYRQLNASKSYKEWRAVAKKLDTYGSLALTSPF